MAQIELNPLKTENGMLNKDFIYAVRNAKYSGQINGYIAAIIVASLALFEIALDRDRAFSTADTQKYNAWFNELLKLAHIKITSVDEEINLQQTAKIPNSLDIFDKLPTLKKELFVSIAPTFAARESRNDNVNILSRRHSFSKEEKELQMNNIITAIANQEGIEYDPEQERFYKD